MKKFAGIFLMIIVSCSTVKQSSITTLPRCIQDTIAVLTKTKNAPQSVSSYLYKGKVVYYMQSACCDQYNILFNDQCKILGYPDGGFSGRGDGTMPDFHDSATNKIIVWPQ